MLITKSYIHKKVSITPLITFRVFFGFIMAVSIIRFAANGWIYDLYIKPSFYFSYLGFEWIQPLGTYATYGLFIMMLIGAIGICLGWFYRISSILFFLTFTYVELIDKTNYLNHYYFVSLVAFLLMWLPAHKKWSMDVFRKAVFPIKKVPAWTINVLKLQLVLVYFFAGLAKLNPYWLFEAMPLKLWLPAHSHIPLIGTLFQYEWVAYAFSWSGMLYDLTIAFFLIWSRTRLPAYITVVVFHTLTAILFQIGMFPYIMILCTLLFFSAEKHEKWQNKISLKFGHINDHSVISGRPSTSILESFVYMKFLIIPFLLIQLTLPLRSMLYPGDLFWTEQGYRFSWRVMLMEKAGYTTFRIEGGNGKMEWVDNYEYLNPHQEKMMSTQPDMILQFAHFLKNKYAQRGFVNPKIYCDSKVTLNGRKSQEFVDPVVDLGVQKRGFKHKNWITEFKR